MSRFLKFRILLGTLAAKAIRMPWLVRAWLLRLVRREKPLRVALSTFGWTPLSGGVGNYMMSLIRGWGDENPSQPLRLYATKSVFDHLNKNLPLRYRLHVTCLSCPEEIRSKEAHFDVFCQLGHLEPVPPPHRSTYNLADLQERFFPEFFTEESHRLRRENHQAGLDHAWRIITGSDFSLLTFRKLLGMPDGLGDVVPLPVADLPKTGIRPANLPAGVREYVYYPADDYLHKNHERIFLAVAKMRAAGCPVHMVCTGGRFSTRNLRVLAENCGLQNAFHDLGKVSRENVAWLYQNARLLLFGSLFEGFGIPVLEGFLCGTPVVCSGVTSLPELGGAGAVYVNPFDAEDMAEKSLRLLGDPREQAERREAARRQLEKFSTRRMIQRHQEVFAAVRDQSQRVNTSGLRIPPIDIQLAWSIYRETAVAEIAELLPVERPVHLVPSGTLEETSSK
jgi:glycosyltransferase involved in cell wall biosynthesis